MYNQPIPGVNDAVMFEAAEQAVRAESGQAVKQYCIGVAVLVAAALFCMEPVRAFLFDAVAAVIYLIGPILIGIVRVLAESAVFLYVFLGVSVMTLARFASVKCGIMRRLARECPVEELDDAKLAAFQKWSKATARYFATGKWLLIVLEMFTIAVVGTQFHRDFMLQPIFGVIVLAVGAATLADIGYVIRNDFWHLHARLLEKTGQLSDNEARNFTQWAKSDKGVEFLFSLVRAGLLPKDLNCPLFRNFIALEGELAFRYWAADAQAGVVEGIERKLQALVQTDTPPSEGIGPAA